MMGSDFGRKLALPPPMSTSGRRYVILRDDDTNALTPIECLDQLYRPFLRLGLPVNLAVANVVSVGADIASAGVTPTPQAGGLAANIVISAYADPGAAGAFAAIMQTRRTGGTWVNLTSSRENEIDADGAYSVFTVDSILDDVRIFFDVTGHTFTAAITFISDAALTAAA